MSNLGPNGTFMPVTRADGSAFMLWNDKLMQTLFYFSIALAVLMLFGIVSMMLNIASTFEMCEQMTADTMREQMRKEAMMGAM